MRNVADTVFNERIESALRLVERDPGAAEVLARSLVEEARRSGELRAIGRAAYALAVALVARGEHAMAAHIAFEATAEFEALGAPSPCELLSIRGSAYRNLGMLGLAISLQTEALEKARATADRLPLAPFLNNLASSLSDAGEHEAALALLAEAETAAGLGVAAIEGIRTNRALVLVRMGRSAEARKLLTQAVARFRDQGAERSLAEALSALGEAFGAEGRAGEGEAALREALALARKLGLGAAAAEARARLADNLFAQGRMSEAEAEARAAADAARRSGARSVLAAAIYTQGRALEARGRYQEAAAAYRERLELRPACARAEGREAFRALRGEAG